MPDREKLMEGRERERERNIVEKRQEKNKAAFVETKAPWTVTSQSSESVSDNGKMQKEQ